MFDILKRLFIAKERPPFTAELNRTDDDYIIHTDSGVVDIIKIKKGGENRMTNTIIKVDEGYEQFYAELVARKNALVEKKEAAKVEALAQVDARYEAEENKLNRLIAEVSHEEVVEVADEVVEAHNEEVVE